MMQFDVFSKDNLGKVRTCYKTEDGSVWFVTKDVCDILGIQNSRDAAKRLLPDEKGVVSTDTLGGKQQLSVVSESGLYTLVMGSRKKEAVEFQRWVTREVLPSIREHGGYILGQEQLPAQEKEELLKHVEMLSKKASAYLDDSNHWFSMYNNLLDEYIRASQSLIKSGQFKENEAGGISPVSKDAKPGFIVPITSEGTWTDKNMFVIDVKEGRRYEVAEFREER